MSTKDDCVLLRILQDYLDNVPAMDRNPHALALVCKTCAEEQGRPDLAMVFELISNLTLH
ncbi:hypothetical protein [Rugamonas apoptosis]|uniref:hypothetical protein n=1 Tax=Rugamonas apoptosis TaxID=2758570 RepID=UPI001E504DF2|nr:hypothetical protein [Rugamonas apoptosis]